MSLRGFHLIFIAVAALFCAAFGFWVLLVEKENLGEGVGIVGYVSIAVSIALMIYAAYFVRKAKNLTT